MRKSKNMNEFIPYGAPSINRSDIRAVCNVLNGHWLSQGPFVVEFEKRIAEYCNVPYAVAVSSGTAALHMACMAIDLTEEDYHWTSPITFVASSNCGIYCGSMPDFVDIDIDTYNMDMSVLEEKLKEAKKEKKLPKVVLPVHFAGLPCDMPRLYALSKEYGFHIIEDACHALGARYRTKSGSWIKVGSCKHSDMTAFSFHPLKHITTGEGGCITTKDKALYDKLLMLRNHGITKNQGLLSRAKRDPWYYEMRSLGFNYRLSDIHCALGISQLSRLDKMVKRRQDVALLYDGLFDDANGVIPQRRLDNFKNSFHLYAVQIDYKGCGINRTKLINFLKNNGIGTQVHYIPVYHHPYYQNHFDIRPGYCPSAELYYSRTLSLPLFADIKDKIVIEIVKRLFEILNKN